MSLRNKANCDNFLYYADVLQEEFSDEEDGQDEDLSAALATLRMQQEARTKDGGSKRPGQKVEGKGGFVGGASGHGPVETAIITQVSQRLGILARCQTAYIRERRSDPRHVHLVSMGRRERSKVK